MKPNLYFFILLIKVIFSIDMVLNAQSPHWKWAKSMGGAGYDYGHSIAIDGLGNVYTTGSCSDSVDFDPGIGVYYIYSALPGSVIFISKLDVEGNFIWAKAFTNPVGTATGFSIAVDDSCNIYIAGSFEGTVDFDPGFGIYNLSSASPFTEDLFIAKLDSSGNFKWANVVGNTGNDRCYSIALDDEDNVIATGFFYGTVDFDPDLTSTFNLSSNGDWDIFISKSDKNGQFIWARAMGGSDVDCGLSVSMDVSGNIYTSGYFRGMADFDPDSIINYSLISNGYNDIFISKFDPTGNFIWAVSMGDTITDEAFSIHTGTGNSSYIYITGEFQGTVDFDPGPGINYLITPGTVNNFILKLDSSGNFIWVKSMATGSADRGYSIAADSNGSVYSTGFFGGTVDFDPGVDSFYLTSSSGLSEIFISKLDSTGNFIWAKSLGGSSFDEGYDITINDSGHVFLTGFYKSSIAFADSILLQNVGTNSRSDIIVAKLNCSTSSFINPIVCQNYISPSGNYIWFTSGKYYDIISNSSGCDSLITVHLTVHSIDTSVMQTNTVLTSNATGAAYQWLDCNNGFLPLAGYTNQIFNAPSDGQYAVAITINGCTDTSACYIVSGVGIDDNNSGKNIEIYPNPVKDNLVIVLQNIHKNCKIIISDITGHIICSPGASDSKKQEISVRDFAEGVYMLKIQGDGFMETKKLIILK